MNSSSVVAPVASLTRHPRLSVELLRPGLFVADLDRPWLDTPFLLQGFLIEGDEEVEALREHCRFVYIDTQMSDPVVVRALQAALQSDDEDDGPRPGQAAPVAAPTKAATPVPDVSGALRDADPLRLVDDDRLRPDEGHPVGPPQAGASPTPAPQARARARPAQAPVVVTPAGASQPRPPRHAGARPPKISAETRERFRSLVREISGGPEVAPVQVISGGGWMRGLRRLFQGLESALPAPVRARLIDRRAARALERRLAQGAQELDGPPPAMSVDADSAHGSLHHQPEGEVLRTSEAKLGSDAQAEPAGRGGARHGAAAAPRRSLSQEIDALLPPGTVRQAYPVRQTVAQAVPKAREAWRSGGRSLENLLSDIRASKGVQLVQVQEAVSDMVESMVENPDAMLWVAQLRDTDMSTYQHGVRSALYMIAVGRSLGFPKDMIESLGLIGMLADVGKTRVPRALLEKPGILSRAEFSLVKEHVERGLEALETDGVKLNDDVRAGILQHHERLDGSGYPAGLKGTAISIHGRIAAIADCFSALTTARPYANAMSVQDALMSLYQWSDTSFHAPLVEQFVQAVGVFPVGSLVELSNDEVAVVLAHNRSRRLEPRVIVLADAQKRPLAAPFERDLFKQAVVKGAKPLRIQRGLPAGAYGLKPHDFYADEALALAKAD
ncbi:MAG: HD-GYP domain-containing protein [Betaproteobacteria bacterium]|nr:HD-GYP domain-containing protein [Betaproteobacteria bacterium]